MRKRELVGARAVRAIGVVGATWLAALAASMPVAAETVESALVKAYRNNPQLNVQRALVRATDENVPQALAGYRPRITALATVGEQSVSTTSQLLPQQPGAPAQYLTNSGQNAPYSAGLTITQTVFNGFQTANRTRAAEGQVGHAQVDKLVLLQPQSSLGPLFLLLCLHRTEDYSEPAWRRVGGDVANPTALAGASGRGEADCLLLGNVLAPHT